MNWKHTKTLLLILLAAVNIFLAFLATNFYSENNFTNDNTAASAAKILEKNGIVVDKAMLSARNDSADVLLCNYDREQYLCAVAALLFGKEADGIYRLPNGIRAETYEGASATIGYDLSLDYTSTELAGKGEVLRGITHSPEAGEVKAEKRMLETLLALPSGSLENAECIKAGVYTFITVDQVENGLPLFGMHCVFGIKEEKIVYANGKHLFCVPEEKYSAPILNRINILFSEKERGVTGTVKDITFCYTLYEDAKTDKMMLVPSYTVTYSNKNVTAINALNKELY
ncbi:MAG: hypothetical protein IJA60_00410 [Clostridia bacterium]|nr:hypothetical protein [Clostridia bacterium]MBQ6893285.1 hypothetical protein [Clostridia bacterium]